MPITDVSSRWWYGVTVPMIPFVILLIFGVPFVILSVIDLVVKTAATDGATIFFLSQLAVFSGLGWLLVLFSFFVSLPFLFMDFRTIRRAGIDWNFHPFLYAILGFIVVTVFCLLWFISLLTSYIALVVFGFGTTLAGFAFSVVYLHQRSQYVSTPSRMMSLARRILLGGIVVFLALFVWFSVLLYQL